MFCINCGKETEPIDSRCTHCGFDLAAVMALLDEPDDDMEEVDDELRSAEEIAKRALTLSAVVSCAYGASKPAVIDWLKKEDLWQEVTPSEQEFLESETSDQVRRNFTWKIEALAPLLWAIGKLDSMPSVGEQCDTEPIKKAVVWPPGSTAAFIHSAELRDEEEIGREYEKVYDAHWKARDAKLNNRPVPRKIDPGAVYERHYGFNWLRGYMSQPWDEITTDT